MHSSTPAAAMIIAVDTGGTFTDLAAYRPAQGDIVYAKSLTTYHDLVEGISDCVGKAKVDLGAAAQFKHGTTLVINTLLERSGAPTALVTTRGFRDILETGRGNRPDTFDLFYRREPVLVPRVHRHEVGERTDGQGAVLAAPQYAEVERLAARLRADQVSAVAISFLNAYLAPDHEQQVALWLRDLLPGVFVTCGSDLSREWYEFERTATVAANAYVGPRMRGYLGRLDEHIRTQGFGGQLFLMSSGGGVLSVARAQTQPVVLIESGPVGGCIGAAGYAAALGIDKAIAFDMGGSTAKAALVRNGRFDVKSVYYVGGYERGFPIRSPVIDIVEVGAGGGSIASLDAQQRLHVGPRSAGSSPGPVCYGRGGIEPTVTDANVVLGRIDPHSFLGGEMTLDAAAAERSIAERIAAPLGIGADGDALRAADGILSIAAVIMAGAIKRITIERGEDPREYTLFAYGGGGPLHAVDLARELHIPVVIIPPEPGNFSAIGMLLANVRRDEARMLLRPLSDETIAAMNAGYSALEEGLLTTLLEETGLEGGTFERNAEIRYRGQMHSVLTPVERDDDAARLRQRFEQVYRARYGHTESNNPVEIVSVRSTILGRMARPELAALRPNQGAGATPGSSERAVYFGSAGARLPTCVYQRRSLPEGFAAPGPALIEEYGSTTLVGPHDTFCIGALGEIRIEIGTPR